MISLLYTVQYVIPTVQYVIPTVHYSMSSLGVHPDLPLCEELH